MLSSYLFFSIPLVLVGVYIGMKFLFSLTSSPSSKKRGIEQEDMNNLQEAKNLVFDFLESLKMTFLKYLNNFLHWLLHFFVIVLKWLSLFTDYLYEKSRDFFLATASKEKEIVATFWHTLKEYKKEKDEQK